MKIEYLFSYGTLQKEAVQLDTFGRTLVGVEDCLVGYTLDNLIIEDKDVLKISNQSIHPIARFTGSDSDRIEGVLFELSAEELAACDRYEVSNYKRVETIFESGAKGWVYIEKVHHSIK